MTISHRILLSIIPPLLLLVGCGDTNPNAGTEKAETAPAAADRPRLAYVTNGVADFWTIAKAGADTAGVDFDADVDVLMPTGGVTDQKRMLEDLVTRQVDGIAVSPIDPGNQIDVIDAAAARTPVITHDSDAPGSTRRCYIGMDNYDAGRMCGRLVKESLPDGGEIYIFVGRIEQDNARRRRQGVIDELLGRSSDPERFDEPGAPIEGSEYTILGTLTDQFDRAKAKANVEDVLSRHPGVDGLVGLFAYNPPLILEALEGAGKIGEIEVIAFDEDDETLQGIIDGSVAGTVVQNPYMYGYKSIEVLSKIARGEDPGIPADGMIAIPARTIRAADVEAFWTDLRKKTGKQ
ncbi:MAG: sugar ABC transporter substrate-binding protein [Phycisphaerae bacterium]|nr:sugar ABC transporter substrate-binding protein [Phycisphaerae bacterium]OUX01550.1 MAG: sugar ABC transporter substrate-binding protein [Phycisphaeraceae bacterium TMED231]